MKVSKYYIEDKFIDTLRIIFKDKLDIPNCFDDGSFEKITGYTSYQEAVNEFIMNYRSEHNLLKEVQINGELYFEKISIDDYLKT